MIIQNNILAGCGCKKSGLNQEGILIIQTAEGALKETSSILQRMRELAVKAASGTNTSDERNQIQEEITQLTSEVDRIANTTEYNTMKLLDGSKTGSKKKEEGSIKVEGNFANGTVEIMGVRSISSLCRIDDMLRITVVSSHGWWYEEQIYSVESLFGTFIEISNLNYDYFRISEAIGRISDADNIDYTYPDDATIYISPGYGKFEIGDVITISLKAGRGDSAAEPGKEGIHIQVGTSASEQIEIGIESMKASDLKIIKQDGRALDVKEPSRASLAIEAYDKAIKKVAGCRSKLWSIQKCLENNI